jgi:uncharacterized protein (DUF302 family)
MHLIVKKEIKMSYYISTTSELDFENTLKKVEEELKAEGFGVLTEIDVKATLKKKLDVDFKKYKILGACNPPLAHKALTAEDKIGVLLPCNVIVEEHEDKQVEVSAMNPMDAMSVVQNDTLAEIAKDVTERLQRVVDRI